MASEIRYGDVGTVIRITIRDDSGVVDISGATTKQILLQQPDGTVVTKTASYSTDGTDGLLQYTTIAGDLNEVGMWKVQGYVVLSTGSWHTSITTFRVYGNIS